jgi:4'-phosphopantetheinyl transferase EntD
MSRVLRRGSSRWRTGSGLAAGGAGAAALAGGAEPGICWDKLLFCAKEATYKAWFPLARRWLGFEDADIVISAGGGSFEARLLVPLLRSAALRWPASLAVGSPVTGSSDRDYRAAPQDHRLSG